MTNETNKPESFAELFAESLAHQEMRQGEVITAEVVRVDYNFVVVNAGLKSEAYVPIEEFKDDRGEVTVQPGDFISVAIESVENGYGDLFLREGLAIGAVLVISTLIAMLVTAYTIIFVDKLVHKNKD